MLPVLSFYWASSIFNTNVVTLDHAGAREAGMRFGNSYREQNRPGKTPHPTPTICLGHGYS